MIAIDHESIPLPSRDPEGWSLKLSVVPLNRRLNLPKAPIRWILPAVTGAAGDVERGGPSTCTKRGHCHGERIGEATAGATRESARDDAPRVRRRAVAAAGVVAGAPAILRGRNLNDKLDIAFIACGGRARQPRELTLAPSGGGRLRASRVASGRKRHRPLRRQPGRPSTRASSGFRKPESSTISGASSTSPNDFDAVVVSTAEHTHALATYLALTHGKHVYCEKPLTHNIWEARLIRETAAKYPKLSTQMGNQGHASPARRRSRKSS